MSHASPTKRPLDLGSLPRPSIQIVPAKNGYPAEGGELDLMVTIAVALPATEVDRKPLNLALVIDRSGSMSGEPVAAAKAAAKAAINMLLPGDYLSVVSYDNLIESPVPLVKVGQDRRALLTAVDAIFARNSTNLFGGWAEGLSQVLACPDSEVISRVVLLSDGLANHGVTDHAAITSDVARAASHGVATTTLGFGRHYDENLLRAMADGGGGNYVFIESTDQVVAVFERELAGISALRGRHLRLRSASEGMTLKPVAFGQLTAGLGTGTIRADQNGLILPDLVAGMPGDYLVGAVFARGAAAPVVTLTWDDTLTGQRHEQRHELDLLGVGADDFAGLAREPQVESLRISLQAAALKAEVAEAARRGDSARVASTLSSIALLIQAAPSPAVRQEEEAELQKLRLAATDLALTSRLSEKLARDKRMGHSDFKRAAAKLAEQEWRSLKATSSYSSAGEELVLSVSRQRPSGSPATIQVVRGDLVGQDVDALVNSSNRGLFGVAGVDGAIHRGAGNEITSATRALGRLEYGQAVFTPGFKLKARYVIHTAAPEWGSTTNELEVLARCYRASFQVAERLGARSIALPAIGTGHNGYPREAAVKVLVGEVVRWLAGGSAGCDLVRLIANDDLVELIARELQLAAGGVSPVAVVGQVN